MPQEVKQMTVLYRAECVVGGCPVVELEGEGVRLHDPARPETGSFRLSTEAWTKLVRDEACCIGSCPMVEMMVKIHDPHAPEHGAILMTLKDWEDIKRNAPSIE
jgi:hypothetical protein